MKFRRLPQMAGARLAGAAALTMLAVFTIAPSYAADSSAMAPKAIASAPPAVVLPPNPAFDIKLKEFFQKRFLIADPNHIVLGPMQFTPMQGVIARLVRVTNDSGQAVNAVMFTNQAENQLILGQMYDMTKDPWERVDLKPLHLDDRPSMGPADAPVTIIEFADFECPFCARAFGELETMTHTTYKDKIRVIFKNYPLNSHPWAIRAAAAAECGRLQNPQAFWEFARDFYTKQGSITPKNVDDHIEQTAKRLSLDTNALNACIAGKSAADRVSEDAKDGSAVGVTSTPTFFVNGVKVVGLPDEKAFEFVISRQIEDATKKAQR